MNKKKILSLILVCCMLAGMIPAALADGESDGGLDNAGLPGGVELLQATDGSTTKEDGHVASLTSSGSTTYYTTLPKAVAAATDGATVTLLENATGAGVKIIVSRNLSTGITIDFGGYTYTCDGNAVGSTGTESQGFHLEKGNKVTLKNGTITVAAGVENPRMLIQNYSELTLDGMTLDGTNVNQGSYSNVGFPSTATFTLNSYNGKVDLKNTTIKSSTRSSTAYAIGCGWWPGTASENYKWYPAGTQISVDTSSTFENVLIYRDDKNQLGCGQDDATVKSTIAVSGTVYKGNYVDQNSPSYEEYIPAGGKLVLKSIANIGAPTFAISTSTDILGKQASDLMQGAALSPGADGKTFTVSGTAKHVKDWTAFDSDKHTGHYLALTVTKPEDIPEGADYTVTLTGQAERIFTKDQFFTEDGKASETVVMYLDDLLESNEGKFTLAFDWDGEGDAEADIYTFDVSGMSMLAGDVIVDATTSVDDSNKATASVTEEDVSTAANAAASATDPKNKVVTIDAKADASSGSSVKAAVVTIPSAAVGAVADKNVPLAIETDVGGITLPKEALTAINTGAGSNDVKVSLEKLVTPTDDAKASFEFTITANGNAVAVNRPMTLRFNVGTSLTNPKIYYNPGNSAPLVPLDTTYDKTTGIVTAETTHNSLYDIHDSGCSIALGTASNSGIGKKRDATVTLTGDPASNGAYLTVQVTHSDGKNLFFTTKVSTTNNKVPIFYAEGSTIKAWLTAAVPEVSTGGVTGAVLAVTE